MSDPVKRTAAEEAVEHLFRTIRDDPRKFWLLGHGTESWNLLSAVYAEMLGEDHETVKSWGPDDRRMKAFLKDKERKEKILESAEEEGFNIPEPKIIELSDYDDCYCAADADDPEGYLRHISGLPKLEGARS